MTFHEETIAQATRDPIELLDPGKLWLLGLAIDADGALVGPGLRRYSAWADCDCPDNCNRDHEND